MTSRRHVFARFRHSFSGLFTCRHVTERKRWKMRRRKHICMLTSVHSPLDVRIFEKEAKTLASAGYQVSIIGPYEGEDFEREGILIKTVPRAKRQRERLNTIRQVYARALNTPADCFHFHDPELIPVALLIKHKKKVAVVYDAHEFLEVDVATKAWIPAAFRKPLSKIANRVEIWGSKRVTGIINAYEERTEALSRVNPLCVTVHNYCPSNLFDAISPDPRIPANSIAYIGVINRRRGLGTVVRAMRRIHSVRPDVRCYLVGRVEETHALTDEERSMLGEVEQVGSVPYREALGILSAADVAWLPWTYNTYNALGLPNKLMEYMAAGKPIVASKVGRVASIVERAECGVIVEPEDPGAHADAILFILNNPAAAAEMGVKAKRAFLTTYCWETEGKTLVDFYERVWDKHTRG